MARGLVLVLLSAAVTACVVTRDESGGPIYLESNHPYLARIRRLIQDRWVHPCARDTGTAPCDPRDVSVVLEFDVNRDGRVSRVRVLRTSGLDVYDAHVVSAIMRASPFPAVPDALTRGRAGIAIIGTFDYLVKRAP
jgi:TonB family protein